MIVLVENIIELWLLLQRTSWSVHVHGHYEFIDTADGFLVLPSRVPDRHYVATSFVRHTGHNGKVYKTYHSELVVSAVKDKINVTIKGREDLKIVLQWYEAYQFAADGPSITDVTGLMVTADKPISVMSGLQCAVIPVGGCDYLMEHVPPVSALGNHYVIAPFMDRQSGYVYRVIATASGMTNITISDGRTISLYLNWTILPRWCYREWYGYHYNIRQTCLVITVCEGKEFYSSRRPARRWSIYDSDTFNIHVFQ